MKPNNFLNGFLKLCIVRSFKPVINSSFKDVNKMTIFERVVDGIVFTPPRAPQKMQSRQF